ncbi:MAG: XisI protein [Microcoleaceae cyanobacterium]
MAVEEYRRYIQELLLERAKRSAPGLAQMQIEAQIIFDTERDHYQLVHVGWKPNERRNYGCVLHLDIKGEKIWIQHDGTEGGIANALVEKGVPKQQIVLGFQPPSMRQYTDFAVS